MVIAHSRKICPRLKRLTQTHTDTHRHTQTQRSNTGAHCFLPLWDNHGGAVLPGEGSVQVLVAICTGKQTTGNPPVQLKQPVVLCMQNIPQVLSTG